MIKKGPITGTYIDEVSVDIPTSNWSREQWNKDLDYMRVFSTAVGADWKFRDRLFIGLEGFYASLEDVFIAIIDEGKEENK